MKVYVTFWAEYDEWSMDKVFATEEKARKHIEYKDQMTGASWWFEEMEVSE